MRPIFFLLLVATIAMGCVTSTTLRAQSIQFSYDAGKTEGSRQELAAREQRTLERFFTRVYPANQLRKELHASGRPLLRKAHYVVLTQGKTRYAVVDYTGRWKDAASMLAIYRIGQEGPIEIWRSQPWQPSYYGSQFELAKAGTRALVLFKEGGIDDDQFSLSSAFTFYDAKKGIILRDVTPQLPDLQVRTEFPFHPLMARAVHLQQVGQSVYLNAKENIYLAEDGRTIEPSMQWKLDRTRNKFEVATSSETLSSTIK